MVKNEVETNLASCVVIECTTTTFDRIKEAIISVGGKIIYQKSIPKGSGKLEVKVNFF